MPDKTEMRCEECKVLIGYVVEDGGYGDFSYQVWYCPKHGEKK